MTDRQLLYVAITSHGFGHAVRTASVVAAIQRLHQNILPVMVTTAPNWLLDSYLEGDYIHRPRAFDVGVIQSDSLTMDKAATLEKIQRIRQSQNSIIAGEVNFIKTNRISLMLADIPPLAAPIAKAAGIPCWMMGNFSWDFIYQAWGEEFGEITDWIRQCYQQSTRLFRLPLSEPMEVFSNITEVGLTGGNPRYCENEIRNTFNILAPCEKTVLLTFGGLGLEQIAYHNLVRFSDWQFITFDRNAPTLPNLIQITASNYRPVDFMPICGRVISKPGYSTFAEALRLNTPIISLTREDFAESSLLLGGIKNYSYHQIITPEVFFSGDWEFLDQPLQPPYQIASLAKDGSEAIASEVVTYLKSGDNNK